MRGLCHCTRKKNISHLTIAKKLVTCVEMHHVSSVARSEPEHLPYSNSSASNQATGESGGFDKLCVGSPPKPCEPQSSSR